MLGLTVNHVFQCTIQIKTCFCANQNKWFKDYKSNLNYI